MNKNIIGHLLAFFTVFVWSTTFVSSKIILQYMTPAQLVIIRFFLGYIALWVFKPKPLIINNIKKEIYFSITATDKIIKIDTKNPFINRKKVIQEGHGNGTKIIKEIAEKRGGDYKASSENGIYTTHTTLRNVKAHI